VALERSCFICESKSYKELYKPSNSPGPVVECKSCEMVFINKIDSVKSLIIEGPVLREYSQDLLESSDLGEIQGSWEEKLIEEHARESKAKRLNFTNALHHIQTHYHKKGNLLDIGCGCGDFLAVAKKNGWNCLGIEPLIMPAIYARGHYGLNVITGTLQADTFLNNNFDVVTAYQVFEHLVYPTDELKIIKKILKPGGLLLIEVPNVNTNLVRLLREKHRHYTSDHVNFFSETTLSKLLSRFNFQIKTIYFPTRLVSLHHFGNWIGKVTRDSLGNLFTKTVNTLHIGDTLIKINIRDIVTVIAENKK
jgi:2-polyprenyl-3-methyl-5-hydroxy-6-metoxy-1,4-benzoquinol methylase